MTNPKKKTTDQSKNETTTNSKNTNKALGQSTSKSDANVIRELKNLYTEKLLPIERKYLFSKFNQMEILDAELSAKVLLYA
jgi:RNA polymerase-interacting CarD/CdnL/TRCF family regulator